MSTADNILDQIDTALHDDAIGPDAMRCTPEPAGPRGKTIMAITGADGEWQEINGVVTVDFHIDPPPIDPEFDRAWQELHDHLARVEAERVRRAAALLEGLVHAFQQMAPAIEAANLGLTGLAEAVQDDQPARPDQPLPRRDRPAWQTPYGPPRRRR
ncbi:hypothetical protein [Streptomyces sp. NBC_01373]|uniref:hypothetical protein n=1 Tax=Streptomyces sp. NBC_01373 TaxID=2903843 RepID=UPI002255F294|nr:hypothetical protein [Streptomyces sp. NBC_01373]MCX4697025.1 hypothetical protein [Streptomyces sp. NBC_01373]MCX4707050.1 hypothetical protein [Streptomyces sp. NBC_01373]